MEARTMPKFPANITIQKSEFDKLKALVHYVCWKCDPSDLGSTKLNKVLWYADIEWYIKNGASITGEQYLKRQFGPVSKHFYEVVGELSEEGKILQRGVEFFGYPKTEYIPITQPTISDFKPEQISLVDDVVDFVCRQHTARSISLASHDVIWELAEIGEEIPLYAVWGARLDEITEHDIQWAKSRLTTKYGPPSPSHHSVRA
jgi:hypothetical protein